MSTNPYEPPNVQESGQATQNEDRIAALRSIRIALVILLIPAVYNFVCFTSFVGGNRVVFLIQGLYWIGYSIGFALAVVAIWFVGLTALEFLTGGIHSIAARKSKLPDWKHTLYIIVRRTPYFAVPGAVLWATWVFAFYQLQLDFYLVSIPIGILSHLLAASLYVPLIYRWHKMERSDRTDDQITKRSG